MKNVGLIFFFKYFRDDDAPRRPPLIQLYTHEHCSLCDDLVEELEMKFHGRFELEKIDITKKENIKFLRLYRLDIPVCFLNGQVRGHRKHSRNKI